MNAADFLLNLGRSSAAAGVLVLLIWLVQRLLGQRLPPAWQSALWLLVAVRLLPISIGSDASLFNLLPPWFGENAAAGAYTIPAVASPPVDAARAPTSTPASPPREASSAPAALTPSARPLWPTVLFGVWLTGALALGGYVIATSVAFALAVAKHAPLDDPAALGELRAAGRQLGLRRLPTLVECPDVSTPALHGLFRPRLLLPLGFTQRFSRDEMRFVFLHELAHVRRHDLALNWITTALQIVHWFNPLVWFAFARWRDDREIACDAKALEAAGNHQGRAYGHTMLRLLEHAAAPQRSPALVGILENRRQLHHRLRVIAAPTPRHHPVLALLVFSAIALAGLTDAREASAADAVAPTGTPTVSGRTIVFLVNASESMLGETASELERWRNASDASRRDAPKWQRTTRLLEGLLAGLSADTRFAVVRFDAANVSRLVGSEPREAAEVARRLRELPPRHAGANLEAAFAYVAGLNDLPTPERIVLITDGLPTTSLIDRRSAGTTESERVAAFQHAVPRLPARLPVDTLLLPSATNDPRAAGLFWELAHRTGGRLTTPASAATEPLTHVAFVIDTSGSMRDPNSGGLWPMVMDTIEATLASQPPITAIQIIDADGRFILGRRGTGRGAWVDNTPENRDMFLRHLHRYNQDSVSNPVPGIANALRFLRDKDAPNMRMGIYVLGDEFIGMGPEPDALAQVDRLNAREVNGRRAVVINAIGFPTTIRAQNSMGNTGVKFAHLMRELTHAHGGAFVGLPKL